MSLTRASSGTPDTEKIRIRYQNRVSEIQKRSESGISRKQNIDCIHLPKYFGSSLNQWVTLDNSWYPERKGCWMPSLFLLWTIYLCLSISLRPFQIKNWFLITPLFYPMRHALFFSLFFRSLFSLFFCLWKVNNEEFGSWFGEKIQFRLFFTFKYKIE